MSVLDISGTLPLSQFRKCQRYQRDTLIWMLGGSISGMHDASVVLTVGSDFAGHYVQENPSVRKKRVCWLGPLGGAEITAWHGGKIFCEDCGKAGTQGAEDRKRRRWVSAENREICQIQQGFSFTLSHWADLFEAACLNHMLTHKEKSFNQSTEILHH